MRHRKGYRKLGRTSAHRSALFRNQLQSMIEHERIVTTLAKAKELRSIVEKMVTLGRNDSVHTRRIAARSIADKLALVKLFEDISVRFSDRPGGYTRIIKLGPRRGDGAEMAILEFIDFEFGGEVAEPTPKKAKKTEEPSEEPEVEEAEEEEESPKKPARKDSKKAASKKAPAKKAASKKAASKKAAVKKTAPKKDAPKKGAAPKPSKKAPVKQSSTRKSSKRGS